VAANPPVSLKVRMAHLALGGFDHDLGATVAAQMHEVCDRLPAPVVQTALVRYGFVEG
jgi:hypothetical protein